MNIPATVAGVLLLAFAAMARGRGRPAWWFPPVTHWTPKIMLEIVPLFGLLALAAGLAPLVGDDPASRGPYGLIYIVLIVAMLVAAVMRVPRWVMPQWLRDHVDDETERYRRSQS